MCQKNKLCRGDEVEIVSPGYVGRRFLVTELTGIDGETIDSTPHPGMEYTVNMPFDVEPGDILRSV